MHRRDFLARVALASLWPVVWRRRSPKFGYAAITWGGNDRAAIDDVSAVGFRGIQLRASAVTQWSARPAELKALLAEHSLTFVALSSGTLPLDPAKRDETIALHVRNAQFLHDAGGLYLQLIDERPAGREPAGDDFTYIGRLLTEIGRRTADIGISVGYHNHMGALGQSPDEFARVLGAADDKYVKLELDIAHCHAAGGDPVEAIRRHAGRLLFLHLKDLRRPAPGRGAGTYQFVELGRGEVNVRGALAELDRVKFDGWTIVELDGVPEPSRTAKDCAVISKQYLEANGYRI